MLLAYQGEKKKLQGRKILDSTLALKLFKILVLLDVVRLALVCSF